MNIRKLSNPIELARMKYCAPRVPLGRLNQIKTLEQEYSHTSGTDGFSPFSITPNTKSIVRVACLVFELSRMERERISIGLSSILE